MSYEKWSAGYWLLKKYVWFVDRMIHRRIIVVGRENIPKDKPVIFAPNHQNALSDPIAVLTNVAHQPVWLARADIFGKSPVIDAILKFLKIMPVYRSRDGIGNLEKNDLTFNTSIKVLEKNAALALFPEGAHSSKRQILPHKKAVPRIAFMAGEKSEGKLDTHIIPTGIYYSSYWKFNRSLIVNFGEAIKVKEYYKQYAEEPQAAIRSLKDKLYDATLPLIINIRSQKHYDDFENITNVYGRHFLEQNKQDYSYLNLFKSNQLLARKLDALEDYDSDETDSIVVKANEYTSALRKLKTKSHLVDAEQAYFWSFVLKSLLLIVSAPIFIFGFIFNALPFFSADWLARTRIKDSTFRSSVAFVTSLIIFPLFYLLEFAVVASLIPSPWLKLLFIISLPFAGKFAFQWYILLRKTAGTFRLFRLKYFKPERFKQLLNQKEELFQLLDKDLV
ncbi:MAG TPA: hypothetical protein DEG09_01290 [Marinilabiliaceae bacterium]|nr:hypothetical protein [Marinilabiliaceae bacterium]